MDFAQSMFGPSVDEPRITIPEGTEVVVVADMFASDYNGGAELTTEAVLEASPYKVFRLHSQHVTVDLLRQGQGCFWIFGNFSQMKFELIPSVVANMQYSVLEYDYKFCRYRSVEKHRFVESKDCDCQNTQHGKLISTFLYGAKSLWWMSQKQADLYYKTFPFLLQKGHGRVLSSVLSRSTLDLLRSLRENRKGLIEPHSLIQGSESWIKGTKQAQQWCEDNGHPYKVASDLTHEEFLVALQRANRFVYLPMGGDTCPRTVIEAKLIGCDLTLNDDVQHAGEEWFSTDDLDSIEAHLKGSPERFWEGIKDNIQYVPSISGYTTTRNCIEQGYPFQETIKSMLQFCSEVIVVDGGSDDGTWDALQKMAAADDRVKPSLNERNWSDPRFAVFDGEQKARARELCTGEFCWQMDSDEVVHEDDVPKIYTMVKHFPAECQLLALPVVEYWGGKDKVRCDINSWKWRLSRNLPHITHGIPSNLRKLDDDGNLCARQGTDGCDYVHRDTCMPIPFATFVPDDVERVRPMLHSDHDLRAKYTAWFNGACEQLPVVYHFSWWNLKRKINTYKGYWTKHWNSLFDENLEDTAETNMFFDKPWSDVSDEEIDALATRLGTEMGGWIFHRKIDWSQPTCHITHPRSLPLVMNDWCSRNS